MIVYNVLSWLIMVLPPAGGWDCRPDWMQYPITRIGFGVIGPIELIEKVAMMQIIPIG